jgi:hypothetical protein
MPKLYRIPTGNFYFLRLLKPSLRNYKIKYTHNSIKEKKHHKVMQTSTKENTIELIKTQQERTQ